MLPPDAKIAIYRIAQEALNNIAKHAQAREAVVHLRCQADQMTLTIRDDGCGFDPASVPPDRLGLGIMVERAEAVGADLVIRSTIGQGTELVVTWPIT
jgi:signal transduction histidine kinase